MTNNPDFEKPHNIEQKRTRFRLTPSSRLRGILNWMSEDATGEESSGANLDNALINEVLENRKSHKP